MPHLPVVVVGAGHSGLAMSRHLAERSIDHVVVERGEVANSWRTERWDSLRLLTPNWLTRLPGYAYEGPDPDGYMGATEVADLIEAYGAGNDAPVRAGTTVTSVRPAGDGGYVVDTDGGDWSADAVVVASGACNVATVPAAAAGVPSGVTQLTAHEYRNPGQVPEGGVLVVGASSSGVQIADELMRHGRPVTISAGEHVRLPRRYRGADILWWMEAAGVLDDGHDEIDDLVRARSIPSMQLAGSPDGDPLDLNALTGRGARLVGRLGAVRDGRALFSGSLRERLRAGRPQADPAARPDRRLGRRGRARRRGAARAAATDRGPLAPGAGAGPGERRDPHDRLGHRLPPRARVAGAARPEPARAPGPRRRRDQVPRRLPHGDAVPAPAQVDADRRRGPGRPRAGRAPGGPPRRRRPRRPRLHPDLARS